MIKSFLGADLIDEWRPRSIACNWGGGGDVGSDSGNFASGDTSGGWGGDFGGGYGGGSDAWSGGDSWSNADSFSGGGFDSGAFGDQGGFDNAASWSSYNGADAPFGASEMSPGESLFGSGGFDASNFVNFNEGQSFPGYYDTSPGVISFNESNPWGGVLSDISNTLTGGFAGGPVGWQGEFGAYGNMAGPSMGYANYAGNVTAPGLVGGFMDAGPFGYFGNQPGDYGLPSVFDAPPPDAQGRGQEMDPGGRGVESFLNNDPARSAHGLNGTEGAELGQRGEADYFGNPNSPGYLGMMGPNYGQNISFMPSDLPSSTQYNQTLGELAGQYGRDAAAMSQLANGMNQYYADSLMSPGVLDARDAGEQGRAGSFDNFAAAHNAARGMEGAQMANNPGLDVGLGQYAAGLQDQPQGMLTNNGITPANVAYDFMTGGPYAGVGGALSGAYQTNAGRGMDLAGQVTANMPWGATVNAQSSMFPGWANSGLTAGLPAGMFAYDQGSNVAAKGDNSRDSFDSRFGDPWAPTYDQGREALNDAGRAQLANAFQSRAGLDILQDQREVQDTQRAPWEARGADLSFENQNMGRPNSYPTLAEFLGPGRGQSQNIYAPERGTTPLQVTVPGRASESSRGVSTPFGGAQQGGRGIQGQMDALLAQARTAPTQAARIAALDALNGLISANYGRGPFGGVGRGPYGGDPDPFIAAMLRMGR